MASMKIQKSDGRTKEDILAQIAQMAKAYVPEWKFDPSHPDAGTALALIFAELFSGTVKRYDRIPEKLRRGFFAELDLKMLPAVPAEGYAVFGLSSHEFGGTIIPRGTVFTGPRRERETENAVYETTEAVYVTAAKLAHLIYIDGTQDYVEKKDWNRPFFPFSPECENPREHVLYLCQNDVLHVTGDARLRLTLCSYDSGAGKNDYGWMTDSEAFSVSYSTKNNFEKLKIHKLEQETLLLSLAAGQPGPEETELFGKSGYWICCRYKKPWNRKPFFVQDIRLASEREGIEPDLIQNEMGEQQNADLMPFGESPAPFTECYFASDEALGKPGAEIRLTFRLNYEKIPLDNSVPVERKWKILMKRADFAPDPEYDITVEQVVWEYYNGNGWGRLPVDERSQYLFNGTCIRDGEEAELKFICPTDAALLTWQCAPTRYVRVRILRMNNLFCLKGTYITPVLNNVRFHYCYPKKGQCPDFAAACNHGEQSIAPVHAFGNHSFSAAGCGWKVFFGRQEQERILYLGFDRPLLSGPVNLFCSLAASLETERSQTDHPTLSFAYRGKEDFAPLSVIDGTDGMTKSGCLTFPGKTDFAPHTICGKEAYWIRMTRVARSHPETPPASPKIQGIYLNAGKILAAERRPPEFFEIRPGEKNKICRLLHGNIYDLTVWVNEIHTLIPSARETLRAQGRLEETAGTDKEPTAMWVKWEETTDFSGSGETDRHYLLDRNRGIITFSDGIHGAIPPSCKSAPIRIEYRCGGGIAGNQPAGTILKPGGSLGFVNHVAALSALSGGCSQETAMQAMRRQSETIRHMGRAVTADDYEALAREASRSVRKVKCLPGCNSKGEYVPGCITLIVLQKELQAESGSFERLREQIADYLSCRMDGNTAAAKRLFIARPQFLEIDCYVRAVTGTGDLLQIQKDTERRLEQFLHPITGNYHGRGWEIGAIPNEMQIRNALKGAAEIRFIRELRITVYLNTGQRRIEIDPWSRDRKNISREYTPRAAVALSGQHTIVAEAE